jgi:subtilisin family serine protease
MQKLSNSNLIALTLLTILSLAAAEANTEPTYFEKDDEKFIITIIDTGVDLKNKDLMKQLWTNTGEMGVDAKGRSKSSNGLDDDGNGFVDDIHGWNFFDNTGNLQDNHGHGTHIAGIIFNQLKKLKIENKFQFQIVKYFDSDTPSQGLLKASNRSFQYALENHSQLINYSGGGYEANKEENKLIQLLKQKNIPIVAAMGNQNLNTDLSPFYPASYGLDNIFAIGAAQASQATAIFSNYGSLFMDFLTPGVQIESYGLNGAKTYLSGTSQSTANASALIAYLIFQENGPMHWSELKKKIKNLRLISLANTKKGNPLFVDTPFIQKFKTSAVDAFGEP